MKARSGWSIRKIAKESGVDEKTVRNDLSFSGAENSAPENQTTGSSSVSGLDGKSYPSKQADSDSVEARRDRVKAARESGVKIADIAKAEKVSLGTVAADLKAPERPTVTEPVTALPRWEGSPDKAVFDALAALRKTIWE